MSGIAGRTNYTDWDKKASSLLSNLEEETKREVEEAKEALGQSGKYASSEAEAKEREKAKKLNEKKDMLNKYKQRELGVVQVLASLLPVPAVSSSSGGTSSSSSSNTTRYVTRNDMEAGKRLLHITDTNGPGNIILTQDLTNLESNVPSSALQQNQKQKPKSFPQDAENDIPDETPEQRKNRMIHGLIKVSFTNLHNCTISLRCKVITGLLEISHCSNLVVKMCQGSTIVTVQADVCQNLDIQFHDAPSGKCLSNIAAPGSGAGAGGKFMYWGKDKDDRIFHAGVSKLVVGLYKDEVLDSSTSFDYQKDGQAKSIGNASAEEVQFITSVVDGQLVTEKALRPGSATGTIVAGAMGGSGSSGGSARAMTEREMKEVETRKEAIRAAVDDKFGNIKITDKEGNEIPIKKSSKLEGGGNINANNVGDGEVVEELYTNMSSSEIESIVKDCDAQKAKGNEAFVSGEYGQAILLYTLALDRAAELPDASTTTTSSTSSDNPTKQLFPRHIVLSNRSACFLKLGHHEKALADGIEAEKLDPTYVKGVFRKGLALHAMGRYQEALTSLSIALKVEPKNKQIKQALQFAEVRFQQEMRKRMEG